MVKLSGPRVKIVRRLGLLPGLTKKMIKHRLKSPGQHGKNLIVKSKRSSLSDDYKERLREKQKLRFNYGVTEKQLYAYYQTSKKEKGSTGLNLLQLLESRLDCLVFRLGFASTIPFARQLVSHGHIMVNDIVVNVPGFICKKFDVISVKDIDRIKFLVNENLQKEEEKRRLMEKRIKRIKIKHLRLKTLLPKHLSVTPSELQGQYIRFIRRNDTSIKVKDLKVVEFYSR